MTTAPFVIEPGRLERLYWSDLWRYRELLIFLAWRDVSVHYKQTIIGVLWAVVRPLATMAVFVVVFSKLAKLPSEGMPYPLLVLAGMLPWQLFAGSLGEASNSLIANGNLISKIYFPRLIVPLSSLAVSLVDFLVTGPILLGMIVWYGSPLTWRLLTLPLLVLTALLAALGPGLLLCALNVRYRDVRYVVPFILQFGLYISPVGFSSSLVPDQYRWAYALNPIVGVIDGFRWAISGGEHLFDPLAAAISLCSSAVFLVVGIWYFRRTERTFADVI